MRLVKARPGLLALAAVLGLCMALWPGDVRACGLFVARQATDDVPYLAVERVLLVWDANTQTEDFVREARFEKAARSFGFVVPVPSRPEVFKVAHPPFDDLQARYGYGLRLGGGGMSPAGASAPVVALSQQRIGSFTAFVLAARDGDGLAGWLRKNGFDVPDTARAWLDHFVRLGFYYVAFRYDAAGGATPGMTSETVRIRFKTPLPYYPYLEPSRGSAPRGPRELRLWFVSQASQLPVGWARLPDGSATWSLPWGSERGSETSAGAVRTALSSLAKIIPGEDAPSWVVRPFLDLEASRDGWGDVLFIPERATAWDDEAIAARWPLLPVLDPRLEGDLDALPLTAASVAPPGVLPIASAVSTAAAPTAERGPSRGCDVSPGVPARDGPLEEGVLIAMVGAVVLARRRRALALVAVVMLGACKRDAPVSGPTPDPAVSVPVRGGGRIAFTRDGGQLLVYDRGWVRLHEVASGKELARIDISGVLDSSQVWALAALPGRRLLVGWTAHPDSPPMLSVYEIDRHREVWSKEIGKSVGVTSYAFALSPDGHRALTAGPGEGLRLWDLDAYREVRSLPPPAGGVGLLAFLGNDRALTTAGAEDQLGLRVWDVDRGTEQRFFDGPPAPVQALAATADGSRAVTLSKEGALRVWDVEAGRELLGLDLDDAQGEDVAVSSDGRRAYTELNGNGGRCFCAWDLTAGALLGCDGEPAPDDGGRRDSVRLAPGVSVDADGEDLGSAVYSPDGRYAARPGASVRYWKLPDVAAPSLRATWPRVPPWSRAWAAPVAAPPVDADRASHERAVLQLMFGRTNPGRISPDPRLLRTRSGN